MGLEVPYNVGGSLVPRPLPDFILQLRDKIWEWPGEAWKALIPRSPFLRIAEAAKRGTQTWERGSLVPMLSVPDFVSQLWRKAARQNPERRAWERG